MSKLEDLLEPSESIIWKGKPDIIAFMLPAFGGVFFALMFLGIASFWLLMGVPILQSPMVIAIPAAIILIVVPPYWQYKQYPLVGYIITDKKLIAKKSQHSKTNKSTKTELNFTNTERVNHTVFCLFYGYTVGRLHGCTVFFVRVTQSVLRCVTDFFSVTSNIGSKNSL